MWRNVSLVGPYFAQASSPRQESEAIEHGHSPRHPNTISKAAFPAPKIGSMLPPAIPTFPRQLSYDPFTEPVHAAFRDWRQPSSDVSMLDYSDPSTRTNRLWIVDSSLCQIQVLTMRSARLSCHLRPLILLIMKQLLLLSTQPPQSHLSQLFHKPAQVSQIFNQLPMSANTISENRDRHGDEPGFDHETPYHRQLEDQEGKYSGATA
jgi:hypothetical protein